MSGIVLLTDAVEGTGITSALTTALSTIASDMMSSISAIVPIALPIMGAIAVVGIGVRIFKKVTSK